MTVGPDKPLAHMPAKAKPNREIINMKVSDSLKLSLCFKHKKINNPIDINGIVNPYLIWIAICLNKKGILLSRMNK